MASPAPAQQGQPQQPPFGASSATGPTPNKGYEAAVLQRLGPILKMLMELQQMAGASDVGKDVNKAIGMLLKHVPDGSVSPAAEKSTLDRMQMQNTQQNAQMQALRQRMMQGGGGGAQGAPQMPPGQGAAQQMQAA